MPKSNKLKEDDFKIFKASLTASHRKYKKVEKKEIERFRNYFRGNHWGNLTPQLNSLYGSDRVTDNVVFSNIKTIMPAINFRNPKITIRATKKPFNVKGEIFDTLAGAVVLEVILNYYFKEMGTKRETDKVLTDALVSHRGIMYTGYTMDTEKVEKTDEEGEVLEINELIKEDAPFTMRLSPRDFRSDPEGEDSHLIDSRWIAIREVKTLSEVKNNKKYINTNNLKTNFTVDHEFGGKGEDTDTADGTTNNDTKGNELWRRVEIWNLWDKKTRRIIGIVSGHAKPILYEKWPLDYDGGFPIDILYFNENPDEALPIADVGIYAPQQDELNRLESLQLEHVRKVSQRKYKNRAGSLTAEEKNKVIHGGDGTIIDVTEGGVDDVLVPIQDANVSQDLYITINGKKNSIREMSGVSRIESGGAEKFDTATEPAIIQQGTENRRDDRTSILEDFLSHVVSKVGKVLQQTLRKRDFPLTNDQFEEAGELIPSKLERIAGTDSNIILPWLSADKDSIQGEYEFTIAVGSTRPVNVEARKQDTVQLYTLLLQNPLVNQAENLKQLLNAFPDVHADMDKLIQPAEQASQEGQAQIQSEIQMETAKGAPKIQADLQKTAMKIEAQDRKVQTDAKVSLLLAELNKQDLKES